MTDFSKKQNSNLKNKKIDKLNETSVEKLSPFREKFVKR